LYTVAESCTAVVHIIAIQPFAVLRFIAHENRNVVAL